VLLLLGDNIYLEREDHTAPALLAAELRSLYARQFAEPGFRDLLADLRARGGHLVVIYDDHDVIGDSRCGGDCTEALRQAARAAFVAAFGPVRTGTDIYRIKSLGPVDLVVLDERFTVPRRSSLAPIAMRCLVALSGPGSRP
jgi:hypothetical protein